MADLGYGPKPTGVSILAVLSALMAVLYLADALVTMFAIGSVAFAENVKSSGASQWVIANLDTILTVETVLLFAIMVIYFYLYIGFTHGNRWGWSLGIGFSFVGIFFTVSDLLAFPGVSAFWQFTLEILIPVVMLFYLLRPNIKHYFRGSPGETETPDLN
ncbi:MAG: hypothetical protein LUO79_02630 [Methanomassiliicoccales archaeon]|nr:hypothetical protein [Methanomassiliicoccales archaeon]